MSPPNCDLRGTDVKCSHARSSSVLQLNTNSGWTKSSAAGAAAGADVQGECRVICVSGALPEAMHRQSWALRDFELTRQLYRGKLSIVFAALDKVSGKQVVLKLYRKRKLSALNWYQVEREISIHSKLEHDSIVKLYAAFEDAKLIYLVQELVPGGDLFDALGRLKGQPREKDVVQGVMVPLMKALMYMHAAGIIHRDIKPENILLQSSIPARGIKLADFGMAINGLQERPVSRVGTLDYMAPEVLVCPDKVNPGDNKENPLIGYTAQVDSWAMGILAFEMLVGVPPFENESRTETYDRIMYKDPSLPASMSEEAKSFIRMALCKNASNRPSMSELFHHPWVVCNAAPEQLVDRPPATARASAAGPSPRLHLNIASPTSVTPSCARPSTALSRSSDPESLGPESLRKSKPQDPLRPTTMAARSPAKPPPLQQHSSLQAGHKCMLAQQGSRSPTGTGSRSPSCKSPAPADRQRTSVALGRQPWPPCEPDRSSPNRGSRRTTANVGSAAMSSSTCTPSPAASVCTPSPAADRACLPCSQAELMPHWLPAGLAASSKARTSQPWYLASTAAPVEAASPPAQSNQRPAESSGRNSERGAREHGDGDGRSCSAERLMLMPCEHKGGRGSTGQLRVEIPAPYEQLGLVALSLTDPTGSPTPHQLNPHPPPCCQPPASAGAYKTPFSAHLPTSGPLVAAAQQEQEQQQGCVTATSTQVDADPLSPLQCLQRGVLCEAPRLRCFSNPGTAAQSPTRSTAPAEQPGVPTASRSARGAVPQQGLQASSPELHTCSSDSGPTRPASMPGNVALPGSPLGTCCGSGMGFASGSPLSRTAGIMSPGSTMRASSRFAELTGAQSLRGVAGPPRKPARTFPSASLSSPNFPRVAARLDSCSGSGSGSAIHRALSLEGLEGRDSLTLDFSPSVYLPKDHQEGKPCRYGGGPREGCRHLAAVQQSDQEGQVGRPSDGLMLLLMPDVEINCRFVPSPKQPSDNKNAQGAVIS